MGKEQTKLEVFIQKMTNSAKDSKIHMLGFFSDGNKIIVTGLGKDQVIEQAIAAALKEHPFVGILIEKAFNMLIEEETPITRFKTEEEYHDYLIDNHLKNKSLNEGKEGL